MPETTTPPTVRPTKKQQQLLAYIREFIAEHGYSPCYREIMRGCSYTSVATVALHVNSLIERGHLRKRDRSARSLEIVTSAHEAPAALVRIMEAEEKWLVDHIEARFALSEVKDTISQAELDALYVLVGALRVLGLDGAAQSFIGRLTPLKVKVVS